MTPDSKSDSEQVRLAGEVELGHEANPVGAHGFLANSKPGADLLKRKSAAQ